MIQRMFLLLTWMVSVVFAASGQQMPGQAGQDAKVMTLRDCMTYAISHSTKMRIQQAEIGDAQVARRNAVLKAFTPTVSGSTYAYYNFGRSIDPETNIYVTETSFHNGYSLGAGIALFDGFNAVNNLKISKTALAIGQTQEKQVEADICLAVMEAYYNVVYYKRLSDIYAAQAVTAEATLGKFRKQEEIGQKSHADVVQAEADLADRQYDAINAENYYKDQLAKLADLMFWPVEEELRIDTGMPGARWQLLPSLSLNAGWSTSYFNYPGQQLQIDPYIDQLRNHQGEYIQFSMSIPIYNRLQGHDNIARKRNALKKMAAQYDQKRRDVESEVHRAVQDRDGAEAAWLQAQKKRGVQEESYRLNAKKMDQGLISSLEYQTATNNFLKAQADEMNSLFKYLIKQAVVRYYNGIEYINQ